MIGYWPNKDKPGEPPSEGWWWLQFTDGPGPRYWDGTFWKSGSYFNTAEDFSDLSFIGPCRIHRVMTPKSDKEQFTFFADSSSVFSQWNTRTPFTKWGIRFRTAENFMMYQKGRVFGASQELLDEILNSDARTAKALGRKVPNFNPDVWNVVAKPIVAEGNYAKFSQNRFALEQLLNTAGTTLVEAAPWDKIWGIGLAADDIRAQDRSTWLGTNWLGEVLTEVRDTFLVMS